MSLLWFDGFECFGTSVDSTISSTPLTTKYDSVGSSTYFRLRSGRTGGYALGTSYNHQCYLTKIIDDSNDTYYVGFGLKPYYNFLGDDESYLFTFYKGGGYYTGIQIRYLYPEKELLVYAQGSTLIGQTARANLERDVWNYVEIKVRDATDGEVVILVNGYEVLVLNNVDTTTSNGVGYDRVRLWCGATSNYEMQIDDWYICNGAGSTHNTYLGNAQIRSIWPTSDGDSTEWGLSEGTDHYALVDDNPINSDTDYTTADSTVSDLFGYADASDLGTISAVQINSAMKELSTAVVPTMKNLIKSGSTVYDFETPAISTGYKDLHTIHTVDPDTSLAWTLTNLNAAQFGVKRE